MSRKQKMILVFCIFFLTVIPFFWSGDFFSVGGDDGRLYYCFPFEQTNYYRDIIISDNLAGSLGTYLAVQLFIPFLALIGLAKTIFPFVNTQSLLFGLNLSGGFLFFYLFLGLFIDNKEKSYFFLKIVSSFFYIFSIFSFYTVWNIQLFSVYLVSVFPLLLYLFIKAVLKENYSYLVMASVVSFWFSVIVFTIPWLMAAIITAFPLIFLVFLRNKKFFIRGTAIFLLLFFLMNFYWLAHFLYAPFSSDNSSDSVANVASQEFREENKQVILDIAENNKLVYPLFNLFHKRLANSSFWMSYGVFENWHLKFFSLNLIFLLVVLLAVFYLRKFQKEDKRLYILSLISWIITLFMFTVNIGEWGISLFLWLNENIPGFVMFRNMHEKFGLAMAFSYAFLLAMSLKIFLGNIKNTKVKSITLSVMFLIIILSAKPFISGEYFEKPIWTTKNTYGTITDFNSDLYDLLDHLKNNHSDSRYLWLPMNRAGYTLIQDKNLDNHYYAGVSPLQYMAKTSDFAGFMSFGKFYLELQDMVLEKKYADVGRFMQRMNVEYIIVNNNVSPELQKSYFYKTRLYEAQQQELFNIILGEKIRDFGVRYSLFKINDRFANKKIYLTDDIGKIPRDFGKISYKKNASYEYEIKISNLEEKEELVFLDPYHKLWELRFKKDGKAFINGSHDFVFDYANGWSIDPDYIKQNFSKDYYKNNNDGSVDMELILYFKPQSYFNFGPIISGLTLLGAIGYLIWDWRRRDGLLSCRSIVK